MWSFKGLKLFSNGNVREWCVSHYESGFFHLNWISILSKMFDLWVHSRSYGFIQLRPFGLGPLVHCACIWGLNLLTAMRLIELAHSLIDWSNYGCVFKTRISGPLCKGNVADSQYLIRCLFHSKYQTHMCRFSSRSCLSFVLTSFVRNTVNFTVKSNAINPHPHPHEVYCMMHSVCWALLHR